MYFVCEMADFIYILVFAGGYVLWWTFSILCGPYLDKKYVQRMNNENLLENVFLYLSGQRSGSNDQNVRGSCGTLLELVTLEGGGA